MIKNFKIPAYFSLIVCFVSIPFLFIRRDVDSTFILTRSMKHLWDFAHFPLFICITLVFFYFFKPLEKMTFERRLLFIILATLLLGLVFEFIQVTVGRYFQWQDIYWDICGSMCAVLLLSYRTPRMYRYSFTIGVVVFIFVTIISSVPIAISLLDEYRARTDFPVLADFSSELQLGRFSRRNNFNITDSGLEISLTTDRYSGFSLNYFPRDWSDYEGVKISLYNHQSRDILFTCRIHDWEHNQEYNDRFNRQYSIFPGEFELEVKLDDVRVAPNGRNMDLTRIGGLVCFTSNLVEPQTITLHGISLYR